MRSAKDIKVELLPLKDHELRLCLKLLSTPLHRQRKRGTLLTSVDELLWDKQYYLVEVAQSSTTKKAKWRTWRTDASEQLLHVQQQWRSAVHGPRTLDAKYRDFDDYTMSARGTEYNLPPLHFGIERKRRTTRLSPTLSVSIRSVEDFFNWLLVRAVANKQLSRI